MNRRFIQNVIDVRGKAGKAWLKKIPEIISAYEKKWDIKVGEPFTLSYNYVAPAIKSDGTQVVLKIGFPGDIELISECAGLFYFKGEGSIKLIEEDIDNGVMLLERVTPGLTLDYLNNDEAETKIACALLKKLHRPAPNDNRLMNFSKNGINGYQKHRAKFKGTTGAFPEKLFALGETINQKNYVDEPGELMLIHGDFHHQNILSSQRDDWLTIDTKGVVGNPAYDVAVFLYNPRPQILKQSNLKRLIEKRIKIFADELNMDQQKIIEWGISQAILSSIWTLEDHGQGWENTMNFAQMLADMH